MAELDFFNQNMRRAYPLISNQFVGLTIYRDGGALPLVGLFPFDNAWIVDAGFVMGPRSGFDPDQHSIHLVLIHYQPTTEMFHFEFRADSEEMAAKRIVFSVDRDWNTLFSEPPRFITYFENVRVGASFTPVLRTESFVDPPIAAVGPLAYGGGIYSPAGAQDAQYGWGYLVVGDLRSLVDVVDQPLLVGHAVTIIQPDFILIEHAQVQTLVRTQLLKVSIANENPILLPDPCADPTGIDIETNTATAAVDGEFTGDVKFREGFNCQIAVREDRNAVEIGAAAGAGVGRPCDGLGPTYEGPLGFDTSCEDLVTSMNGVRPGGDGRFSIKGQDGIRVVGDPENNRLLVTATPESQALCQEDEP